MYAKSSKELEKPYEKMLMAPVSIGMRISERTWSLRLFWKLFRVS